MPLTAPNVEKTTTAEMVAPPRFPSTASAASAATRVEDATFSSGSAEKYAAAPRGAITPMSIHLLPEPKLAMAAGASVVISRLPTMLRTAAVTTMTLERSGSA